MSNNFSVNSCYAVLSVCSNNAPLHAFLELVIALVDEKKYSELDPQTMSDDFLKKFKFPLPYHPMQAVIRLGIEEKYFEYNSSLRKPRPIWSAIDSGEFMKLVKEKEAEYNSLLRDFGEFLKEKYNLFCSQENLSDQVQAFIQRYGLVSKADMTILGKVKNDYHFAEYMLHCNEIENFSALNYIDEYTTGCAFAEVMTFSVPPDKYKNCDAKVFLDTGFIFALLGIGSKDRSESFKTLFYDMVHLGMKPTIFEHTYSEIAGIIDTARNWIGNNDYNPSLASETAYYFVTNNWSYFEATELLGDLRRIITDEYKITIDDAPYPHAEDIHTQYEEAIKNMIVEEYTHNNKNFSVEDKEYTINQDARSIFMILHYNNGYVARTLPDVKNIFITTNRTLARVGAKLTSDNAHNSGNCIPIVLTDLTWGTLIWANSQTKISPFNRANIISAAYAAFRPSEEILKALNRSLLKCQTNGTLSPEKCYFLKTNALALQLLADKTQNDESRYSDRLPFEILKELRNEGYQEGLAEKQKEVNQLENEKEEISFQLSLAKQRARVNSIRETLERQKRLLVSEQEKLSLLQEHILTLDKAKNAADKKIRQRQSIFKVIFCIACLLGAIIAGFLSRSSDYSWIITAIGAVLPFGAAFVFVWRNFEVSSINVFKLILEYISQKTYAEYGIKKEDYNRLKAEERTLQEHIQHIRKEVEIIASNLKQESLKIDEYSVDMDVINI